MTISNALKNKTKDEVRFTEEKIVEMGKRIKGERERKGIKQSDLAEHLAIGKNQMYRIESGQVSCKAEYLYEIAQILDVSLDYLFYGKKECTTPYENDAMKEIMELCAGREPEELHKALNILRAFFD